MPQIKVTTSKGLFQQTAVAADPMVKVVSDSKSYVEAVQNESVLSTDVGVHTVQEVITLAMNNALVAGKGEFAIPRGAVLLEASVIVLAIGADAAGNGINLAFGNAGTAVGGTAVTTVEFLGDGGATEIPAGDIAIGNAAVAGQTVQATNTALAIAGSADAHLYVNNAGNNSSVTGSPKILVTYRYVGKSPVAL